MQMLHQLQALVRDWLEGRLDTYMTITPAANWNHKTFASRPLIGLKSQVIGHFYWHNHCDFGLQEDMYNYI